MILELPNTFYKWQEFDCFQLASILRSQLNRPPLPDFSYIYDIYNESNCPATLIKDLLVKHAIETNLDNAELACLNLNGVSALATVYNKHIIFITKSYPVQTRVERVSDFIDSFWIYKIEK